MRITIHYTQFKNCPKATQKSRAGASFLYLLDLFDGLFTLAVIIEYITDCYKLITEKDINGFFQGFGYMVLIGILNWLTFILIHPALEKSCRKEALVELKEQEWLENHRTSRPNDNPFIDNYNDPEIERLNDEFQTKLKNTSKTYAIVCGSIIIGLFIVVSAVGLISLLINKN